MKDFEFIELYEIYKNLFTARRRKILDGYYDYDLSLSELAEESGTTRQSVYDAVKKAKIMLNGYEKKLGVLKLLKRLDGFADTLPKEKAEELRAVIGGLGSDE